jgi:aminomethyltransferase
MRSVTSRALLRSHGRPIMSDEAEDLPTQTLPLDAWHRARGARMVAFAGYHMPIQYDGIMAEHLWTRSSAGLFDVSHMGQLLVSGPDAAGALEALLPGDIKGLAEGKVRYSLLLNQQGGILDDLMVTNIGRGTYYMVVNGATKWDDIAHLREHLPDEIVLNYLEDQALLAVQGPKAVEAVARIWPQAASLYFMEATGFDWNGVQIGIGRSGYTGEDGVEITLPGAEAEGVAELICQQAEVKPIGLGARDSLRLEAGLPLYGHDLDEETTPVMADLGFALSKRRREERSFPGAERILLEREQGPVLKRVGLFVEGRQPVREGAAVMDGDGNEVGRVTSGGFSPSLERPIAMAYVPLSLAEPGSRVRLNQRTKIFEATVTPMPFVPHRYHRKGA